MFPTLIFVDGKGKVIIRHEGPATAIQLLEMASYLEKSSQEVDFSLGTR